MSAYYNEIDPFAARWLRSLISAGHIPHGDVDERSIEDVSPNELTAYTQHHFFAGIGGWAYALRLAGWPDERPVLTGSCPCQPYSSAGKGAGFDDERHLWPAMFWLIQQQRPPIVFGEQVASKTALEWWDLVANDLERENYATAAADLPAASVGAPHLRSRLFWLANANSSGRSRQRSAQPKGRQYSAFAAGASDRNGMANAKSQQRRERANRSPSGQKAEIRRSSSSGSSQRGTASRMANPESTMRKWGGYSWPGRNGFANDRRVEHSDSQRLQKQFSTLSTPEKFGSVERSSSTWRHQWINCLDGKQRPVKPGLCLLAHGVSGRVGRLRGYGNAIVPQVAAEFIKAFMEISAN